MVCAIAGETKLETPEGPLTIKGLAGKPVSVFTREQGRSRFRMMRNVQMVGEAQPVVRISLENGASFRVGPGQILIRKDGSEVAAEQLVAGDLLVPMFSFPEGYELRDDRNDTTAISTGALRVTAVEPAGTADLYGFEVNVTGTFFVAAGVLCRAGG